MASSQSFYGLACVGRTARPSSAAAARSAAAGVDDAQARHQASVANGHGDEVGSWDARSGNASAGAETEAAVQVREELPQAQTRELLRRERRAAATSSFYGSGGRTEAEKLQDRSDRSTVHIALNKEIMSMSSVSDILAFVEGRHAELDKVNLATALQRIAKLNDVHAVQRGLQFAPLLGYLSGALQEFRPHNLTTTSWSIAKL